MESYVRLPTFYRKHTSIFHVTRPSKNRVVEATDSHVEAGGVRVSIISQFLNIQPCFDTNPAQEREVVKGRKRLFFHGCLQLCGVGCLLDQRKKLSRQWNGKDSVEKCFNIALLTYPNPS